MSKNEDFMRFGVDIGGTNIKFVVVDGKKAVYQSSIKTAKTAEALVADIAKEYRKVKAQYPIGRVGVGVPGLIYDGLVTAVNLDLKEMPLQKTLEETLGVPVTVENDANCAAIGELYFGSAAEAEDLLVLSLGTGIGGGIIIDKKLYKGARGVGGELGHMIIHAGGRACPCGQKGCFEQYASVTALIREATAAAEADPASVLHAMLKEKGALNGKDVFTAMDQGDEAAKRVFAGYVEALAAGLDGLTYILDPEAIILAGGITYQGDSLLKPLKEAMFHKVRVDISVLQGSAGSLGAAML